MKCETSVVGQIPVVNNLKLPDLLSYCRALVIGSHSLETTPLKG